MMKRIYTIFLAFVLVLGMVPGAFATEVTEEATEATEQTKPVRGEFECGEDLTWAYDDGVLTITGTGEMDDYEADAPWAAYKDDIESVILTGGVTYIGARAFKNYDALKTVDFGSKLKEIGEEAFWSCEGLSSIELPATFKTFGPSSFLSCKNLAEIHCNGVFPSFKLNCLWDTYATIYYPVDRPWSVSLIAELEEAFHGRIEFLASDGTDPYTPEEATVAAEETAAPETEAPTEMPTETTMPATEATVEVTEAPTETAAPESETPETEAPTEMTQAPTEAEERDPNAEENSVRLLVIGFGAAVVLTLCIALAMVLRQLKRKGKYST